MPDHLGHKVEKVSKKLLWQAWVGVRKSLRKASTRDVIDFADYDIEPHRWLDSLNRQIIEGRYDCKQPRRFRLPKSKGIHRAMVMPQVPDLVLYRAVSDELYKRWVKKEKAHVFFEVKKLSEVQKKAVLEARLRMTKDASEYSSESTRRFLAWLRYDQYRKFLIFDGTYKYIVLADISAYFDSILHSRLLDVFATVKAPHRMLGLLTQILERMSYREPYGPCPQIGLPVDEFDCSRKLAHVFLFGHDERMVKLFGENRYVRWMDDQNFGAETYAEALKIVSNLTDSLNRLHLVPNSAKTKILTITEAKVHFQLRANAILDLLDEEIESKSFDRKKARMKMNSNWRYIFDKEGHGEWEKILKRTYRVAACVQSRKLMRRAKRDLMAMPNLAQRIFDYYRSVGSVKELIEFVKCVITAPEQIYSQTAVVAIESLLRVTNADVDERREVRKLASDTLGRRLNYVGWESCQTSASLLLFMFGDLRSAKPLKAVIKSMQMRASTESGRSCALSLLAISRNQIGEIQETASQLSDNVLHSVCKLYSTIVNLDKPGSRLKDRLKPAWDAISRSPYLDARQLLFLRLLSYSNGKLIRRAVHDAVETWIRLGMPVQEVDFARRLLGVV